MKRKVNEYTVSALASHLRRSRRSTLQAIRDTGINLTPTELHYTDTEQRSRRNWRPLTKDEADRVIAHVRSRSGARALARKPSVP